jgi:potassium/chloride transporter 9
VVLLIVLAVGIIGARLFARASIFIFVFLILFIVMIFISFLAVSPMESHSTYEQHKVGMQSLVSTAAANTTWYYTGLNWDTFLGNVDSTYGPDIGSHMPLNFQAVFGILFPACTGIMAGANMSGDLRSSRKSIPTGTNAALLTTFITYVLLMFGMAATTPKSTLVSDPNFLSSINLWSPGISIGIMISALSSAMGSIIGGARVLQALARDDLIPGLKILGAGSAKGDEPHRAVFASYLIVQIMILYSNLNLFAQLVTMFFLMSYCLTNLACLALAVSNASNFRPTFRYFHWTLSLFGTIVCLAVMFFVNPIYAVVSSGLLMLLFLFIHYLGPPQLWGDVSQALVSPVKSEICSIFAA